MKLDIEDMLTRCRDSHSNECVSSSWSVLPVLVVLKILSLLKDPHDRRNVRLVCHHWCKCMNDWRLWRKAHVYIHKKSLTIPELTLLSIRKINHLSLCLLPPSSLTPILDKLLLTLPQLRIIRVDLQERRRKIYNLRPLLKLKHLQEVTIGGEAVPVTIPDITGLNRLHICGKIQASLLPSAKYKSLWMLDYNQASIYQSRNDNGTICINHLPNLYHLCIRHTDLTQDATWIFRTFADYPLTVLDLSYCVVCDHDLRYILSNMYSLQCLNLNGIQLQGGSTMVLEAINSGLTTLCLRNCKLENYSYHLNGLCYSLSAESLLHLDLAYCTGVCLGHLLELMCLLPSLKTIDLTGWNLTEFTKKSFRECNVQIIC